ncbi:MAG: hypothetical protein HC903_09550 [Methylacidiphilales bacterium]|nr:hypothetical protein [Candidatus Methylacidiphilales bacterium]
MYDDFYAIRVIDWKTRESTQLSRTGNGNWVKWLISQGYDIIDATALGCAGIYLYKTDSLENIDLYAIYFPYLAVFDIECLFINIPTEAQARTLIASVIELLQPLI